MSDSPTAPTADDPWPENRVRLEATFEGAAMLDKPPTKAASWKGRVQQRTGWTWRGVLPRRTASRTP